MLRATLRYANLFFKAVYLGRILYECVDIYELSLAVVRIDEVIEEFILNIA